MGCTGRRPQAREACEIVWDDMGGSFHVGTDYVTLDQLKPGSLYITTPSANIVTKPKPDAKR